MICHLCKAPTRPEIVDTKPHPVRRYDVRGWLFHKCTKCGIATYSPTIEYLYSQIPYHTPGLISETIDYEYLVDRAVRGVL